MNEYSRSRAYYLLFLLTCCSSLSFVDRKLPMILIELIREDIPLTDTQIGVIGGLVFTLVYAVAGIAFGRAADLWSRKKVIGVAVGVWAAMTAFGGVAANFVQFAMSRIGLASGEAALAPAATSMIADVFPQRQRRTVLSIFLAGNSLGTMGGMAVGGILGQMIGWRMVLLLFSIPALILSALMLLTVREPQREGRAKDGKAAQAPPNLRKAILELLSRPAFRHLLCGVSLVCFGVYSVYSFYPAYLIRHYGLTTGEAGLAIGVIQGVSGVLGTALGGMIADKLGVRDIRWTMWLPTLALVAIVPLLLASWWAPTGMMSLVFFVLPAFLICIYLAPSYAAAQSLGTVHSRGTAVSVMTFGMYAIGGSLGPIVTGMISDHLKPEFGDASLRYALSIATLFYLWAAAHFWMAARRLPTDIAAGAASIAMEEAVA